MTTFKRTPEQRGTMDKNDKNIYFGICNIFVVSVTEESGRERKVLEREDQWEQDMMQTTFRPVCHMSTQPHAVQKFHCLFSYDWLCTPDCCPIMTKHDIFGLLPRCHCQRRVTVSFQSQSRKCSHCNFTERHLRFCLQFEENEELYAFL